MTPASQVKRSPGSVAENSCVRAAQVEIEGHGQHLKCAAIVEGRGDDRARGSGRLTEEPRVINRRAGTATPATVPSDVEDARHLVAEDGPGRDRQVPAAPGSNAAVVERPAERDAATPDDQPATVADGRDAGAAQGAVGPVQRAVHRESARAGQDALGHQQVEMAVGVHYARAIDGQSRAIQRQGLGAAESAHRQGAAGGGGASRDREGVGAGVGDEGAVRRCGHLGGAPIPRAGPIARPANPSQIGCVEAGGG